ncbi:hypothetical protein MNBD_GAMMA21-3039 [hydrothermal vent metagenome]|uniref:DUF4124 domain-containing protein n=1 Tax=hydrothermal vent metagenome TaxID=652676 RepID=A0A3B1AID9_9ZZZZ
MYQFSSLVLVLYVVTLPFVNSANARQVYKSVDAEGNITYSSSPTEDATQTEKMRVTGRGQPVTESQGNSNIEQIKDLAGEMEKDRIQRQDDREAANKKRDEAQARKQAEAAKKQAQQKAAEPQERYYPVYVPRPHHPARPEHRRQQRTFP